MIKLSTSAEITHEIVQQHLRIAVEGTAVKFSDSALSIMTDMARVRKIYKLNTPIRATSKREKGKSVVSEQAERKELEVIVLGLMALRGAN